MTKKILMLNLLCFLVLFAQENFVSNMDKQNSLNFQGDNIRENVISTKFYDNQKIFSISDVTALKENIRKNQVEIDRNIDIIKTNISTLSMKRESLLKFKDVEKMKQLLTAKEKSVEDMKEALKEDLSRISNNGLYLTAFKFTSFESKQKFVDIATNIVLPKAIEDINGIFISSITQVENSTLIRDYIKGQISGEMTVEKDYIAHPDFSEKLFVFLVNVKVSPLKKSVKTSAISGSVSVNNEIITDLLNNEIPYDELKKIGAREEIINEIKTTVNAYKSNIATQNNNANEIRRIRLAEFDKNLAIVINEIAKLKKDISDREADLVKNIKNNFKIAVSQNNLDASFQDALKIIDKDMADLINKSLEYKENELILQESAVSPEGNIGDDIAKTVMNVYKQMKSKYEKVEQFIEITEVENYQLTNYEKGNNKSLFREIDKIWVYPIPDGSSFRLAVVSKFKIYKEDKNVGSISISVSPSNSEIILTHENGKIYNFRGNKSLDKIPVGKYNLIAKAEEYDNITENFTLKIDEKINRQINLKKISKVPTDGLVGYWSFDNGDARDESGNGNNGSVFGRIDYVDGVKGKAAKLYGEGNGNYIVTKYELPPFDNEVMFTASCWVKNNSFAFGSDANSTGQHHFYVFVNSDINGKKHSYYAQSYFGGDRKEKQINLPTDKLKEWNHIVIVKKSRNSAKLYMNGLLIQDNIVRTSKYKSKLSFGRNYIANWQTTFKTVIDEVRIYNRALSESEIQALYNDGK